jgi:hypothetical protein
MSWQFTHVFISFHSKHVQVRHLKCIALDNPYSVMYQFKCYLGSNGFVHLTQENLNLTSNLNMRNQGDDFNFFKPIFGWTLDHSMTS